MTRVIAKGILIFSTMFLPMTIPSTVSGDISPEVKIIEQVVEETTVENDIPEETTEELVEETTVEEIEVEEENDILATNEDIELLALVTLAEAEGESEKGKRLVIDTILNRVDHEKFPDTIHGVVYQKNQFTSMWNGRCKRVKVTEEVRQLIRDELESRTNYDVIFFTARCYSKYGTPMFQVGNHCFSSY